MSSRILLVEDEPGLVVTISDLLTAEGDMSSWRAASEKVPAATTRVNTSISPERLMSLILSMNRVHR